MAEIKQSITAERTAQLVAQLHEIPAQVSEILSDVDPIKTFAKQYGFNEDVFYIGRGLDYAVSLEGALKLKEIAYLHAEGFAAGELKHGPIALVEEGQPVFIIVPSPGGRESLHSKVVSNIQEVRARGAITIVIAEEGDKAVEQFANHVIRIPESPSLMQPLLATVPLQLFAATVAESKGYDVDQPRNLAKSVTVE